MEQIINELSRRNYPEGLRFLCGYLIVNPSLKDELLAKLQANGFDEAYHYLNSLSPYEMRSLSYSRPRMNARIKLQDNYLNLVKLIGCTFVKGAVYPKKEAKRLMGMAYQQLGIDEKAKASDLSIYLRCKEVKDKRGTQMMKIL